MDNRLVNLFYGSLLHDIGKIVQRSTQQKIPHSKIGADYLKKFEPNDSILDQIKYHHYADLVNANIKKNNLAYITYIADNIASGVDRREHDEEVTRQWDSKTNLEDIFNKFGESKEKRYFQPSELNASAEDIFPKSNQLEFTSGQYSGIMQRIEESLKVTSFTEKYRQSMLNLLEATASFIPSSTNLKEVVDISLYDHMKMTAAFASAIYLYLNDNNIEDYQEKLFKNSSTFYNEKAFVLASFDLSGIQNFIYTITSSGAHKQLRSRSFYLDMISEWIVDYLLNECGLTRANMMYSGGGHAYLILPNTHEVKEAIKQTEQSFNKFFLSHFATQIYVAFGSTPFSANEVMSGNTPEMYRDIFQRVSHKMSEKKLSRYSYEEILNLNKGGKQSGRECAICHTVDALVEGDNMCILCDKLEKFSKNIQNDDFFEVNNDSKGLPIGPKKYLHNTSSADIKKGLSNGHIYAKNHFHTGSNQATRLLIADYSGVTNNNFNYYAKREWTKNSKGIVKGVKRLAVLRCDVDDLGYAFIAGFSEQGHGKYNTFTRTASFSRSMSLFFKLYINSFAANKMLTIIYAGGDDVFLLGAWDDVLNFSIELRQHFIRWTNGKLTMSAGIGIYPEKTPINIMARKTGELEGAAKNNGKDSISLFTEENTFSYDVFIDDIYNNKLNTIRKFFNNENERGISFIYKILELIRNRDEENRIAFARLAYYLARLEDISSNKEHFNTFKLAMKDWFEDKEQIRRAEVALLLYVYEIREEGK